MSAEPQLFPPVLVPNDPRLGWPSVTRILKAAGLSPWMDVSLDMLRRGWEHTIEERKLRYILTGVYPEILDAAAERGQLVHQACSDIENGMAERWWEGEDWTPYVLAYLRFKEDTGYVASATEQLVFHEQYKYRGTFDSLGTMGKYAALLDVKTTVQMPPDIAYQLAAYDLCLPADPKRLRFGVQLKRDGYQIHEYKDRNDSKIFLAALSVAQAKGLQP